MYIHILSDAGKLENLDSITFFGIPFQTAKRVKNYQLLNSSGRNKILTN